MKERWTKKLPDKELNMGKAGHFWLENLNTAYEVFE